MKISGQTEIDQLKTLFSGHSDQMSKRDLGTVAPGIKHRLAEETAAEADPVQTADQFIPQPAFKRMGIPHVMQGEKCL